MSDFFNQILTILTTSPGNLVYFLTLAFTIAVAFQISINQWRRSGFPQGSRLVIGLSLLLLVQLAQFIFAALTWQNLLPSHSYLPPLDRAVTLVSLVVITWLWLFPEPSSAADVALVILSLLIVMFFVFSLFLWQNNTSDLSYNSTTLNKASVQIGLSLLGISTLLLIIRRPNGWGFGLAMSIILAAGYGLGFVFSQPDNDYMGIIRLTR
jgi:hypothetical protein